MIYLIIIFIISFLLILFLYLYNIEKQKNKNIQSSYIKGIDYVLSDDFDKAISEILKVVEKYKGVSEPVISLGNIYRAKGDIEKAIQLHSQVSKKSRLNEEMRKEAYYYLGIDFKKAGFFDRASKIFDSFRKEKNRINALEQLEGIYVELNEWDNAIEIRNKLLEEYNGDKEKLDESRAILAHFYTEKANEEINKGDINNGKTFIEKAISLNPTLVYTIFSYSSILLKENKLDEIIERFELLLENKKEYSHLILDKLEKVFSMSNQYLIYGKFLEKHLTEDNNYYIFLSYIKYLRKTGNIEDAIKHICIFLDKYPNSPEGQFLKADLLVDNKKNAEALTLYRKVSMIPFLQIKPYRCNNCGYEMESMLWRCPRCGKWDTVNLKEDFLWIKKN